MSATPTEVSVVVEGLDLDDEAILDVLAQHFDDLLFSESAGIVTATVMVESDPIRAALEAADRIRDAFPDVRVPRVDPDLVTVSAIATRVGVSRQAVRQWVTGPASTPFPTPFPTPFAALEPEGKPMKVWRWADVTPWLAQVKGLAFESLPTPQQMAAIDAGLGASRSSSNRWGAAPYGPSLVHAAVVPPPTVRVVTRGA